MYPPPEDPMAYASSLPTAPSPFINADHFGMLPLPESPVPSHSTPAYIRHRQTASLSSGTHPPSPLAQAPLVRSPGLRGKGKDRAR